MKKGILLLFISLVVKTKLMSQDIDKFKEISNKMLLGIPLFQTDSSIKTFLNKHLPFLEKESNDTSWSVYKPDSRNRENDILISHSFYFQVHPFFDFKISQGKIEMFTKENQGRVVAFDGYKLYFYFKKREDAIQSFNKIIQLYEANSIKKYISIGNIEHQVAGFEGPVSSLNFASFTLSKYEFNSNKYQICFYLGMDTEILDKLK